MASPSPQERVITPEPEAPRTPSRIPFSGSNRRRLPSRPTTPSRRPSFASPTKASIAKHNPQLLNRAASKSTERDLRSPIRNAPADANAPIRLFSQPNAQTSHGNVFGGVQAVPDVSGPQMSRAATPIRSVKGGFAASPRRRSRSASPTKNASPRPLGVLSQQRIEDAIRLDAQGVSPFKRTGLRRSPSPTKPSNAKHSAASLPPEIEISAPISKIVNPFAPKLGLRRSPVASQPSQEPNVKLPENEPIVRRAGLRRSPVNSQITTVAYAQETVTTAVVSDPNRSPLQASLVEQSTTPTENIPAQREASHLSISPQLSATPRNVTVGAHRAENLQPEQKKNRESPRLLQQTRFNQASEAHTDESESQKHIRSVQITQPFFPGPAFTSNISTTPNTESKNPQDLSPLLPDRSVHQTRTAFPVTVFEPSRMMVDEPELPLTPLQRGIDDPIVTTPPSGIHNSPKRLVKKKDNRPKSSPLKPRDETPQALTTQETVSTEEAEIPSFWRNGGSKASMKINDTHPKYPLRRVDQMNPHAGKKDLRDQLLREVQQLQVDVKLAELESERLSKLHASESATDLSLPAKNDILKLLFHTANSTSENKSTKAEPSIFASISQYLPFAAKPRIRKAEILSKDDHPISHAPISLDNPLPYLQAFSTLSYTSSTTLISDRSASSSYDLGTLSRSHHITASHPSGLFSARIKMIVNTSQLSITSLTVPSMTSEAEPELGLWFRNHHQRQALSGKDITTLCWAMSNWAETAMKRARFWLEVEQCTKDLEQRSNMIKKLTAKDRQKRTFVEMDEDGDDDELARGERGERGARAKTQFTRKEMLLNIGRQTMNIMGSGVQVEIKWIIGLDWIGDVESSITATSRLPAKWAEDDERRSLTKVPETFRRLVESKGPLAAVKTIVALLMSS